MPKLSMSELAAQYGYAAAFFNADAELRALIQAATSGQWTTAKFQAKFMATRWYRAREASVRQWADLTIRDPKEAQNKINERKAEFADQFAQLGITISDAQLASLASQSLQYSWSDAQTKDVLASYVKYEPGKTGGGVAAVETSIKQLARDYGVTVSNAQMQDWISGVVGEKYTEDSLRDFITDMARSKYAGMDGYLTAGMTVRDVAAPFIQSYANLLEVDPGTVNLDDPKLAQALQGKVDPKTKMPAMQSLWEFERDVRKDSRWLNTKNARSSMADATIGVLKDMGLYA